MWFGTEHRLEDNKFLLKITSIKARIWFALSFTVIVALIFVAGLFRYRISDEPPKLMEVTEEKLEEFGPFVARVKTGLYIRGFPTFDVIRQKFVMDAVVWFEFNQKDISLERVKDFSFMGGTIESKSTPDIKLLNGKIFVSYQVRVSFTNDLSFHYYPFDSHYLQILLTNYNVEPGEMVLETADESFNLAPDLFISNWVINNMSTAYGFSPASLDTADKRKDTSYSESLFLINFSSMGIKNSLIIFIPLIFALLLALFSLLVPYDIESPSNTFMVTLSSGAITSLLAYRFVIQTMLPRVGYLTTTDLAYMLFLIVAFVPFFLEIMFSWLLRRVSKYTAAELAPLIRRLNIMSVVSFMFLAVVVIAGMHLIFLF